MKSFIISDLHLGTGDSRDNFHASDGPRRLGGFLDYVRDEDGRLIIAGDLFEFWQSNVAECMIANEPLLDRLAAMHAVYVVGNHDCDIAPFADAPRLWINHPLFRRMVTEHIVHANGRRYLVLHGHEGDKECAGLTPGFGRITAIISGILEDRAGGPFKDGVIVEDAFIDRLTALGCLVGQTVDRNLEVIAGLNEIRNQRGCAALIAGHTHLVGRAGDWYYNAGCWCWARDSFVRIDDDGAIGVFDWVNGQALQNNRRFDA